MATPVVLINVFEVPIGTEDAFIEWWRKSSEALRHEPGFIDARLHQSRNRAARFQFINVAHWETEAALHQARARHQELLGSLAAGKGTPALYEVAAAYSREQSVRLPTAAQAWGNG